MEPNRLVASPGVITVDLAALARNWRSLARLVAPAECGAVVKADAYGIGAARAIPTLAAAGCRTFFIATPEEGAEARRLAPGCEVFALDGLIAGGGGTLLAHEVSPVLSSLPEVAEWAAFARARGRPLPCALHIDSGLNRLGLTPAEVAALAADSASRAALDVRLVMSHLASADDPAEAKNAAQRVAFEAQRGALPAARASLAASDGLMLGRAYHYDLVRPGYALYGGQAFRGGPTPVEPVVRVEARVLQVRDVAPGETVGYSATWRAPRPSRIAVLAAGYADGCFRTGSNPGLAAGAEVAVGGRRAPVVGRISMDLITVDVTDLGSGAPKRGDLVELVGPTLSLETVGHRAGTIGYEVLTSLSRRFARVYVGGEGPVG